MAHLFHISFFFEIPVTGAPSVINASVQIYWEPTSAFMFTRAPIWLQFCLNFYFHIKCYIHLRLSFRMHPHELKHFIVYIFFLRSLILEKLFENYIEIQIVVWFSKLFLGMYIKTFIVSFSQMQQEILIISNGQFFKFQLVPYFSKSIMEFFLSISSKFKFYLYFDYLIDFFLSMSIWIKMYANL